MPTTTHPNHEDVLAALRNIRYPAGLRSSVLLDLFSIRAKLPVSVSDAQPDDLAIALRNLLTETIDKLRPPGEENLRQREWLRYYVLHHLFRRGDSNQTVQQVLGISRSYLYEIRNEAVDALATMLLAAPRARLSLSEPIPLSVDFVGRQRELAAYRHLLSSQHLATIHGFAGTGKTALAAQLAAERQASGQPVIWITLSPGINVDLDGFLDALAICLEELGHNELRTLLLNHARNAPSYPADARINYAVNSLVANQIVLCLDDIHLVDHIPEVQRFLASLAPRQQPARIPLIVTSRTEPLIAQGRHTGPLHGLSNQDGRLLLQQIGVNWLSDELYSQLQQQIAGNAAFLRFFTAWAQNPDIEGLTSEERESKTQAFIAQIGASLASHRFLLDGALSSLEETERSILERVALSRKPVNLANAMMPQLFADLDLFQVPRWLSRLERMHLLMRSGETAQYRVHDLVKTYLVAQLAHVPERQKHLHQLLAVHFESMEDYLETAYHLCRCGDPAAATRLLIEQTEVFIQKGQAAAVVHFAPEIKPLLLPAELRFRWYEVLARATWMAGLHDNVVQLYSEALAWPDLSPAHQAILHWRLANAYEIQGSFAEAIAHCQLGLNLLPNEATFGREWIMLTMTLAAVAADMGDLHNARAQGLSAIEAMEANPNLPLERGKMYGTFGNICKGVSDYGKAKYYMERSLEILQETGDFPALALALNNLAGVLQNNGELNRALEVISQAETIFDTLSDSFGLVTCYCTRADLLIKQGLAESSLPTLFKALSLSQSMQSRVLEVNVLLRLGKTHLALGRILLAADYFQHSSELGKEIGLTTLVAEAEAYLEEQTPLQLSASDRDRVQD